MAISIDAVRDISAGSLTTSASLTTETLEIYPGISVAAGDKIALQHSVDTGDTAYGLFAAENSGFTLAFGQNSISVGSYYRVNGHFNVAAGSGSTAEATIPIDCSVTKLAVYSDSSSLNGATLAIHKNGSGTPSKTVVISASLANGVYSGVATVNTSFVAGDRISIVQNATNIFSTVYVTAYLDAPGFGIPFGGQSTTGTQVFPYGGHGGSTMVTIGQPGTTGFAAGAGIPSIAYRQNAAPSQNHTIYKNNQPVESVNMQATSGVVQLVTPFSLGDEIMIQEPSGGTSPGASNYLVFFG